MVHLCDATKLSLCRNKVSSLKHSSQLVSTGRIYVEPVSSLVMDSVIIKGDGFKKFSPVTIQASIKNETENIAFDSCGHFITNDSGAFNLEEAESLGGTYTGVSKMGLFWSMVKREGYLPRLQTVDASAPLCYNFKVFDGHLNETSTAEPFCTTVVKRYFISKDIERNPIRAGSIRGTLFSPPGDGPFPAIVTLYGGIKQKRVVEDSAAILANYGFVTLALAYFGVDDLPRSYQTQPVRIEYFEEAVNYLEGRADVIPSAIGVLGFSNGGSIGLGMMSYLDKVKAVAAINACVSNVRTHTTYGNKKVEMLGYNIENIKFIGKDTIDLKKFFYNPSDRPKSIYPFENSSADLLVVAGLDDCVLRSCHNTDIAKFKMDSVKKTNYEILKYPGLGHLVDAPYMPPCTTDFHPLLPLDFKVYFGGKDKQFHSQQQVELWQKVISFFQDSLVTKN